MPRLLVIHHSPTPTMQTLTSQVIAGANDDALSGIDVVVIPALDFATGQADHEDLITADGYVLGTSANFGYMSGALKHVFDATFWQVGGALDDSGGAMTSSGTTRGRPVGLFVHGRYDTSGAVGSVLAITGALGWKQGYQPVEVLGESTLTDREDCYTLGATIAALLAD